jgi:hypothetical protein
LSKKQRFRQFISQNVRKTARFFAVFVYFGRLEGLLTSMTPSTTTPGPGASDCGQGMTQSLPLFYWSPEKSYMTSSHTATLIYIAARFRVKQGLAGQ